MASPPRIAIGGDAIDSSIGLSGEGVVFVIYE
jgi:hypothetical protein